MVNIVVYIFLNGLFLVGASQDQSVLQELQSLRGIKPLATEFADYFQNATLNDLGLMDPRLPTQEDILCLSHLTQFSLALRFGQYWALKIIDSWGSIPSGILTGNRYDFGNFDECLNIQKDDIRGKYCFLETTSSKLIGNDNPIVAPLKISTATCILASCSANHMNKFLSQMSQSLLNVSVPSTVMSISDSSCQTGESEPWDGLTIFTIVFLSLMGCIVALFTLYDYFMCKNQNQLPTIVMAFSVRANSRSLFRISENNSNPNVIDCLHGMRCMSLIWVFISHEFDANSGSPNLNLFHLVPWLEQPLSSFILHGYFSVDTFLFLDGFLVAWITLRSMDKTKGKLNVLLMYLHRLIRILPILATAIIVYCSLMGLLADGPLFKGGYGGKSTCEKGWYWTLLFVNNYTNVTCLAHTWYLSVDMQLFIISPILLICLYKWGKKAAAGICILIALLSGCLFATMLLNHYSLMIKGLTAKAQAKLYCATHTHATPWLIGFLFGYFLHVNRGKKFRLSWISVWSGWILSLAMMFTSIFALYPSAKWRAPPLSTLDETFYITFTRLGWPLALCWVVFACIQGFGGFANSFLSCQLWQPLSRLSYSVYIWHIFILEINARSVRTNTYFSNYQVILKFWSCIGITVLLSYVMFVIIEAPFGGLDYFIRPQKVESADSKRRSDSNQQEIKPDDYDDTKDLNVDQMAPTPPD